MRVALILLLFSPLLIAQTLVYEGKVLVNGAPLKKNAEIKEGDVIETKAASSVRFNIDKDVFKVYPQSKLHIVSKEDLQILNVINGAVMGVFGKSDKHHMLKTVNMTAGIRGTGVYIDIEKEKTYFCTCYGQTHLHNTATNTDKISESSHHDMYWFSQKGIKPATDMRKHTDDHLRELEKMVGRVPDFDKNPILKKSSQ